MWDCCYFRRERCEAQICQWGASADFPRTHKFFRLDPQSISDTIDVVEVGDNLGGVVDGAVIEAVSTQFVEISGGQLCGIRGDLHGKGTESAVNRQQISLPPIRRDLMGEAVSFVLVGDAKIGDLSPEVVGVGPPSVETVVVRRDDGGEHLPLPTTQR